MLLKILITLALGAPIFGWGMKLGRILLRQGATANDLFKGKNAVSLLFLGLYIGLILITLHVPQWKGLPLEWRLSGLQVSWMMLRVMLLGFCGVAFAISWQTARIQVVAIGLIGILGVGAFNLAENFVLEPIYPFLVDNLLPNGIFEQTSNSSCAPSALANVLRQWGMTHATESSAARFAGTTRLGTSMPQLVIAARAFGMDALELSPTWEQMQRINRPGVLATWLYSDRGRDYHAVALLAMTDDSVTLADSAFGELFQINRQQFDRIWRHEYLPIFRPGDIALSADQAIDYLRRSGHLTQTAAVSNQQLKTTLQQFQHSVGVEPTGNLDPKTVLLLTGPFLADVPRLNQSRHRLPRQN